MPRITKADPAGAADEEMFMKQFEDVPRVMIYTSRDLEQELSQLHTQLNDTNLDWEKRAEAMKRIRSIMVGGGCDYDEFLPLLKTFESAFQLSIKDLRSKVVREACITIAYLSHRLGNKMERLCESFLPSLFNLIPNSAKIMSTCGVVCIRFIIQYTHGSRLIPVITYNMTSKAKDIRKACCEFLDHLLHTWPTQPLEKHVGTLQEAIKKGISDADPEARAYARKAFWGFADHFKYQADVLLSSLDPAKQKMLHGEQVTMSASNSTNSLVNAYLSSNQQFINNYSKARVNPMTKSVSSSNSIENLTRPSSSLALRVGNRSRIPVFSPPQQAVSNRALPFPLRSTSAIDESAVRRARARAAIAAAMAPRNPSGLTGVTLSRGTATAKQSSLMGINSPERVGRPRGRVSQSQPSSRSASPSSAFSYLSSVENRASAGRVRRKSGIPQATSRESSPTRNNYAAASERRLSSGSSRTRLYSETDGRALNSPLTDKNAQRTDAVFADAIKATSVAAEFAAVLACLRNKTADQEVQKEALKDLVELNREASSAEWSRQFKEVFKLLLEKISDEQSSTIRAYALRVMCDLLMRQTKFFQDYIELIILRILEASKDSEKEVQRASEVCAGTAAAVLPSEQCARVLKSVIATGEVPMNQAAIKMLTKLVEQQPKSVVMTLLPEIMPALVQAYDHQESAVRKASVFNMVAIHNVVGDDMKAYLTSLNGSKMKLLKLYIERSKAQSSGCSSPISQASVAAC